MCLRSENSELHRGMAKKLAMDALCASRLGKTAKSGRRTAYLVKAQKLSVGLLKFSQDFRILDVQHDPSLGVLILVRLPVRGRSLHVPISNLSAECQSQIQATVVDLLSKRRGYAQAA